MADKGGMSEAPGQVTYPSEASKPFKTDAPGVVYPSEIERNASEYLAGEGSMGFERNQQVKRDGWNSTNVEVIEMGQHQLEKLKSYGSYAI